MAKSLIGKVLNLGRPIPFNSKWNVRGDNLYGSGGTDRFTLLQTTQGQGTLFAIVQLLSAGGASATPWKLYRTTADGRQRYTTADKGSDQRVEVLKHQALKLWKRPNPFMPGSLFREIGWQFMELVGEWYWVLNRGPSGTGIPIEIWPVRPDRMEPVPDRDNFLAGWVYTGPNGEAVPLTNDEVIQIRYPHPTDFYRGLSPVQSLLAHIDSSKYTAEWGRNFFLNSATPGGIVQFAKRLTDKEFNEFVARWREQHQGVARGHRVGVLEQGAIWIPNTYTLRDMQFTELGQFNRDTIREAYRVHQSMLGISTDVNRANAETAEEVHIRWHEIPRLIRQRTYLDEMYLPMFGAPGAGVEFDFADPNPSSVNDANDELTAKTNAAKNLVDAGYDPEEVCRVVGLPQMSFTGPPSPAVAGVPGAPALAPAAPAPRPSIPATQTGEPGNPSARQLAIEESLEWLDVGKTIVDAFGRANGHRNGNKELV